MENQTKREVERGLLLKLRESVNEQEELDWVEAELALLDAQEPTYGNSEHSINTVAEAVRVLAQCGFVAVQVQSCPEMWVVDRAVEVFSGNYTESEVVQLARGEHALRQMRWEENESCPRACPAEPRRMELEPINTVADAVGFCWLSAAICLLSQWRLNQGSGRSSGWIASTRQFSRSSN